MKKLTALLLAALMVFSLVACSSNKSEDKKNDNTSQTDDVKTVTTTPAEIEAAIAKALGEGYLATVDVPEEELFMSAIGRLDLTKVKAYVAKQAVISSVDLDSVVIAECEDGYADEAVSLLNEAYAQTIDYIRQYPFGVAKVEGARLYKVGNTVMLIIAGASYDGEDGEAEAKLAAKEYEKIDAALRELFGSLPDNLAVVPKN